MEELNCSANASKRPMLFFAMAFYYVGMSVNCLLTPSPYSAYHSGKVGTDVAIPCTVFFISPAYIILGAEAVTVLLIMTSHQKPIGIQRKSHRLHLCLIGCFCLSLLVSGLVNLCVFVHPLTYLYNVISVMLAGLIAEHDSVYSDISATDLSRLGWVWGMLAIAGLGLCLALPFRYGYLPFEFSRTSRGEVTYWMLLGLYLLIPVLCGLSFWSRLSSRWFIAALCALVTIVCLSTVTRSVIVITLIPWLCVTLLGLVFFAGSVLKRSMMAIALLCGITVLVVAVSGAGLASPEDQLSLEASADVRIELWQFHWDNFLRDPIFGVGPFSLYRNSFTITDSQATCEIGVLSWFSEYGIFPGAVVLFWVIMALYRGTCALMERRGNVEIGYLFCVLVFASLFIFFLFEDLSRILDWLSFLFWYSMFYLNGTRPLKKPENSSICRSRAAGCRQDASCFPICVSQGYG